MFPRLKTKNVEVCARSALFNRSRSTPFVDFLTQYLHHYLHHVIEILMQNMIENVRQDCKNRAMR